MAMENYGAKGSSSRISDVPITSDNSYDAVKKQQV